jgi:hypothetical protein
MVSNTTTLFLGLLKPAGCNLVAFRFLDEVLSCERLEALGDVRPLEQHLLVHQSFHGSLASALMALQETWLRDSSATSLEDVLRELKAFRAELASLFAIEVREPDRDRHRRRIRA